MQEKELRDIIRATKGPCPDVQQLVDFVEESLPLEDRRRIADHLIVCGFCANEARLLREAESADALQIIAPSQTEAEQMRRRLDHVLRGKSAAAGRSSGFPRRMAFAMAAAILVLLYPAYIGFRQLIPIGVSITTSMEVIHLETAVRDASAAAPAQAVLPKSEWTGLMFWVPISSAPDVGYKCHLQKGAETVFSVEKIKSFDGLGNFLLSIRSDQLKPDAAYELVVNETGADRREWRFFFFLQR